MLAFHSPWLFHISKIFSNTRHIWFTSHMLFKTCLTFLFIKWLSWILDVYAFFLGQFNFVLVDSWIFVFCWLIFSITRIFFFFYISSEIVNWIANFNLFGKGYICLIFLSKWSLCWFPLIEGCLFHHGTICKFEMHFGFCRLLVICVIGVRAWSFRFFFKNLLYICIASRFVYFTSIFACISPLGYFWIFWSRWSDGLFNRVDSGDLVFCFSKQSQIIEPFRLISWS